ncbi:MAG: hypothetical protein P1V20_19710 [Verrucomicrobiales bacterium]|nr:hypothetical protein [Verrucomicrobiales bacterium]
MHKNCLSCHSDVKRKGGLVITSRESLLKGGDSGEAMVPGKAAESYLIETLYPDADSHMPPKKQLEPRDIAALEEWINQGAKWNTDHWKKLTKPEKASVTLQDFPAEYSPVMAMALSPDGKTLLCGKGSGIDVYTVEPAEDKKRPVQLNFQRTLPGHADQIQAITFSPDGKSFVSGGFRKLILRNIESIEETKEITEPFLGRLTALSFSPDGKRLLVADSLPAQASQIHVVDVSGWKIVKTIENAHDDSIFDLEHSADGKLFASVSADKMGIVRDGEKHKIVSLLEGHTGYVLGVAFSPDGTYVATSGDDEAIKIWDTKKAVQSTSFSTRKSGPVGGLFWAVDPDNLAKKQKEKDKDKAEAINIDRVVAINDLGQPGTFVELKIHEGGERSTGARERRHDKVDSPLTAMAYDASQLYLYAGSEDGRIFIWDKAGKKIQEYGEPLQVAKNGE